VKGLGGGSKMAGKREIETLAMFIAGAEFYGQQYMRVDAISKLVKWAAAGPNAYRPRCRRRRSRNEQAREDKRRTNR
jgi:hypothetical protein